MRKWNSVFRRSAGAIMVPPNEEWTGGLIVPAPGIDLAVRGSARGKRAPAQ